MYHVKGLGQITQEFAYPVLFLRFYHTTGTKIDDNWENDDNENSIINPFIQACSAVPIRGM